MSQAYIDIVKDVETKLQKIHAELDALIHSKDADLQALAWSITNTHSQPLRQAAREMMQAHTLLNSAVVHLADIIEGTAP